jgi:flagellar hook-length control protein FliK
VPQIVSLLPAAPATPAAAPATPTGVAPVTMLPPDLTSPNFLAQFKSALKNLAGAVALPQILTTARPAAAPNGGPLMSPVTDEHAAAVADKPVDANMPALLAELGFAIVPPSFVTPPPVAAAVKTGSPGVQVAQAPVLLIPQPPARPVVQTETATLPVDPGLSQVQSQTPLPQAPSSPQLFAHLKPSDQAPTPAPPAPVVTPQPTLTTAPTPDRSATVIPQPVPAVPAPATAAPAASPLVGLQQAAPGSGAQSGNTSRDHGRRTPDKIAPLAADTAVVQSAPVSSDAAMLAAAATSAPVSAGPPLTSVGPSAVVSQIARHADLIRLPGNRGLRIELHPDDLGGVQVTVRYSPAGGVELHINAEHAATGALVQAGWAELRDSLASQGISADRLMMSVTAPSGAGQADLSGGGNRSDPNAYSSNPNSQGSLSNQTSPNGQGQDQSRQDTPRQPASEGWNGPLDPISSPDGDQRVASATAAPSRIDYRV